MFFKEFFKNKLNIILMVLSILSLVPFSILFKDVLDLMRIKDVAHVNEKLIHDVLTRTLLYAPNLIAFIIGIMIWVSSALISALGISYKKIRPTYAFFSLVLGGIALHIIVFFTYWLISIYKSKNEVVKHKKGKMLVGLTCLSVSATIPVALIIYPLAKGSFDDPYVGNPIEISFDEKNPNLLEIFSDGLDRAYLNEMKAMKAFSDFNFFDKFQTIGPVTDRSIPSIYDDFSKNNPFARALIMNYKNEAQYTFDTYTNNAFVAGIAHMHRNESSFGQRSIVNTNTFYQGKSDNYGAFSSGVPKLVKDVDPKLNVTNWSGARDSLSGSWGISKVSPDIAGYKWLENNLVAAPKGQKGARIYTSDLITHRPFLNNASGLFNLSETSWEHSKTATFNSFAEIIEALKAYKNPDSSSSVKNAYDNTMIVIYGDHSSHETVYHEGDERSNTVRKTESLLTIKYPNRTGGSIVSDRYLYAGQVNAIINDYFTNALINNTNPLDYFKSSKFDNVNRPTFLWNDRYTMSKWENNKLVPQKTNGEYDIVIDRQNLASQVQELNKDKDHYE